MNNEYECCINNINTKIIIHRTSIELINNIEKNCIGFFDIIFCKIINNRLVIKTEYFDDILINSNNNKKILKVLIKKISNLKYDVK